MRKMVDGLERAIDDLRRGTTSPERAFERLEELKTVVGPPAIVLPAIDTRCAIDADCALTPRRILDDAYRCCFSNIYSAGTVGWTKTIDRTCGDYESLRGRGPMQLPDCESSTGPISANAARCTAGRCVACLVPNDGSAPYCDP